ncbi:MAG: prolipoprotein diacylglyceryl transferase [Nitrospirae bacterium]|nr:MAG: prolipoprotein diacylglyceryl transferase [Nitrospirota bacterium]
MHPILFRIGPITVHTYGVLLAAAYLAGMAVVSREAARLGVDRDRVMDWMFWGIVGAIVGARLLYVALDWRYYLAHPLQIVAVWNGGLVFYGGVAGGLVASLLYLVPRRLPVWTCADLVAPALALGQGIGRWGCLAAGCCYGRPTHLPWAIRFHDPAGLAPKGVPLHPTQLYDSAAGFLLFGFLWAFRRRKRFEGQVMLLYLMLYSVARSTVELFRGDAERGLFFGGRLSTSQLISAVVFAAALLLYLRRRAAALRDAPA